MNIRVLLNVMSVYLHEHFDEKMVRKYIF